MISDAAFCAADVPFADYSGPGAPYAYPPRDRRASDDSPAPWAA